MDKKLIGIELDFIEEEFFKAMEAYFHGKYALGIDSENSKRLCEIAHTLHYFKMIHIYNVKYLFKCYRYVLNVANIQCDGVIVFSRVMEKIEARVRDIIQFEVKDGFNLSEKLKEILYGKDENMEVKDE